jgi:lipopolysaccharide export system permease protein
VESVFQRFDTRREYQAYEKKNRSRHEIEIHKKFTLSIACIIFFFIGAPLGAIIRKGGLSVPIIVSVLFFIIYYLIDNTGRKLAENDEWAPWAGVWLSSYVLAPIGIFLTWRAINDSTLFDWDSYRIYFRHAKKKVQAWWKSRKKQK